MDNKDYEKFFLDLCRKSIDKGELSIGADMLRIAAGFQALAEVGSDTPHSSAFNEYLWPQIDLELVAAGHDPIFRKHYCTSQPTTVECS